MHFYRAEAEGFACFQVLADVVREHDVGGLDAGTPVRSFASWGGGVREGVGIEFLEGVGVDCWVGFAEAGLGEGVSIVYLL